MKYQTTLNEESFCLFRPQIILYNDLFITFGNFRYFFKQPLIVAPMGTNFVVFQKVFMFLLLRYRNISKMMYWIINCYTYIYKYWKLFLKTIAWSDFIVKKVSYISIKIHEKIQRYLQKIFSFFVDRNSVKNNETGWF